MNLRRIAVSVIIGFLFGLMCAYMATIRKPIEITPFILASAVYVRSLAGLFIGLLEDLKFVEKRYANAIIRGAVIGFLLSAALSMPWGFDAVTGFGLFGAIYGIVTDLIATKLS